MISAEVLDLFAQACECFIQELTLRAWLCADDSKRKTLQRSDVAMAISRTDIYDFLVDIVPREEGRRREDVETTGRSAVQPAIVC